ncbi:DUF6008 family protein [Kineosporia sp. NBRC 101731]|uniref:DUF6008 family protein n=1 Tax=Kineosporia sp. NBRC 101731 TaxID=3032199 RepID=UPI002556E5A6|nr:DUF6008 family protein [Kineosporia sp. NBRC 101731]
MDQPMQMAGGQASLWDTLGAAGLGLWAIVMWAAVLRLAVAGRRPGQLWVYRASLAVIGAGVIGQLGHVQEHIAQVGYWAMHPEAKPWMTPWGDGLARGFSSFTTDTPGFGMEILHFVGNSIFLAGIVGVALITRHTLGTRSRRWGVMGTWMQGIHGVEHLVLTLSVGLGAARPIGLSTWLGLMPPGPGLWTYRIWWHFLANIVGTAIFAVALRHLWRERAAVRASWETGTAGALAAEDQPETVPVPAAL